MHFKRIATYHRSSGAFSTQHSLLFITSCLLLICSSASKAQRVRKEKITAYDSTYYIHYKDDFVARIYGSEKYTTFDIKPATGGAVSHYRPNTKRSIGIGFTYRPLTLNVGFGLGFLNTDVEKGITKSLDVKSNIYGRKWVINLFAQYYKGFYLDPIGAHAPSANLYYVRPDVRVNFGGFSGYHVFNHNRFSYRAAFVQDTRQKKSAGSFLAGGSAYYTDFHGDSSIAGPGFSGNSSAMNLKAIQIIQVGPGAGYAYYLVLPLNLFIVGSATANLNLNFVTESQTALKKNRVSVNPGFFYRLAAGYSNGVYNLNASWFDDALAASGSEQGNKYNLHTGNFRITFAKRFTLGEKSKRLLRPIKAVGDLINSE